MTDPRRAAIDNLKRMIQVQFDGPEAPDEEVLRSQIDALVKVNKVLTEDDAAEFADLRNTGGIGHGLVTLIDR
jgi:hypothetical protein